LRAYQMAPAIWPMSSSMVIPILSMVSQLTPDDCAMNSPAPARAPREWSSSQITLHTSDEEPQAYPEELSNTPLHSPPSMKSRLLPMAADAGAYGVNIW
jgi:hypothetical protein